MIAPKVALLWACLVLCASAEPLSVGGRRQLLFDDRFVEQSQGIQHTVHPPRKTGDVVVASEAGLTLGGYHSVMEHEGVYHLWYTAGNCILYARSQDGVKWEKPDLGLGRRDPTRDARPPKNLVLGRGVGDVQGETHGLMVFLDPNAPEEERFRLVANPKEYQRMVQLFSSPDAVHWRHTHRDVITFRSKKHHLDSQNVIFWDDRLEKYVAYVRRNLRGQASQGRTVARAESPDLKHFPSAENLPVVMRMDKDHPGHHDPLRKGVVSLIDAYTNGTVKYPWAEDAYFMFPSKYYHYGGYLREFRREIPTNAGPLDVRFAAGRDGVEWPRYDRRPFVRLGMLGEFDSRQLYMVYGVVPALNGRELYMYYYGTSALHGWNRDQRNDRLLTAAGLTPTGPGAISRLVLRRDGFVSLRASTGGGQFTTPLLTFQGDRLLLNVDTSAAGELRVEVLDERNRPITGYALDDCDIVHTTNEINRTVTWGGNPSMAALAGKPVRLRFEMRDVDLYAFQFAEDPAGESD